MIRTILCLALTGFTAAQAADLEVSIEGIEDRGGKLYVSVQTESEYMRNTGTAGTIIEDVEPGDTTLRFDVPPGAYAVSLWHDFNDNGTFDMGADGMPVDGWAVSGGTHTGEPSFADAAVTVGEDGADVTLTLSY